MPRLPVFEPETGLVKQGPNVEADARSYGIVNQLAAQEWGQIAKAGDKLTQAGADLNYRITRARRLNELADATLQTKEQLFDLEDRVRQENPDPAAWVPKYKEGAQEIFGKLHEGLSDPQVQAGFKQHFDSFYPLRLHGVRTAAREAQIQEIKGGLYTFLEKSGDLYLKAGSAEERQEIKGAALARIDAAVQAGALHRDKAEAVRQNFDGLMNGKIAEHGVTYDYYHTAQLLADPEKNFPGLDLNKARLLRNQAQANIRHDQDQRYQGLFQQVVEATAAEAKVTMPDEGQVRQAMASGGLRPEQANNILGYLEGAKHNPENKNDPASYKAAVTRLTDPDQPLSREEFLKNVKDGVWQFDAKTYGVFLSNIAKADDKLPKQVDSLIKAKLSRMKLNFHDQYRLGDDYYQTGLAQLQQARDEGVFDALVERVKQQGGKTDLNAEVGRMIDGYFQPHLQEYHTKMATWTQPPAKPKGVLERVGGWLKGGEGQPAAPGGDIRNDQGWMNPNLTGSRRGGQTPAPEPKAGAPDALEPAAPRRKRGKRFSGFSDLED